MESRYRNCLTGAGLDALPLLVIAIDVIGGTYNKYTITALFPRLIVYCHFERFAAWMAEG
jgi:hypothetical protein